MKSTASARRATPAAAPEIVDLSIQYLSPGAGGSRIVKNRESVQIVKLRRRGVDLGTVIYNSEKRRGRSIYTFPVAKTVEAAMRDDWTDSRPLQFPGAGLDLVRRHAADIARTLQQFDSYREGADFSANMRARLARSKSYQFAGASTDLADPREIEKAHAVALDERGRAASRDLYAKLCWISTDDRDPSLRIRFSFGSERLRDWMHDARRAEFADGYAAAAHPECAVITKNSRVLRLVEKFTKKRIRLSERIIYNNAPGGGAVFHHDAESRQLGVVYAQIAGETAWLAIPKRELAARLARHLRRTPERVLRDLDEGCDPKLEKWLNETPAFAAELVLAGHFYLLKAGDIFLMPSNGPDDVTWHSVFATGATASLSLSFGIFAKPAAARTRKRA